MKTAIVNFLKFLFFLSIGVVILYFIYNSQNEAYLAQCAVDGVPEAECSLINKVVDDFKGLNGSWVLGVFICFMFSHLMRALRWNMLLKSLGRTPRTINSFLTIMLGYFANLGLPRMGEVVRSVFLARYEKVAVEKVIGTIVVDRIMDVLCLIVVVGLAFILEFDTLWNYLSQNLGGGEGRTNPSFLLYGALAMGGIGVILASIFRKKLQQTKLFDKFKNILKGFADGILSVRKLENPALFLFYTVMIWVAYFSMFYMFLPAFNPTANLGLIAALMVFVFGTFGIVIPSPGGMGSYHFLVMAALALYGVSGSDAFSFANFSFFAPHLVNIILGLAALLFLPIINKNYQPIPIE